jgi:hypothetical protein
MEVTGMQKSELLHLHLLMFHIRMYFEAFTHDEIRTERYNALGVSPLHLHKDRKAHKDALLTLGSEIVSHILGQKMPAVNYTHEPAPLPLVAAQQ